MKNYLEEEKLKYNNGKPFGVWISSIGHYNEGELTGGWLMLPATREEILKALQSAKIGEDRGPGYVYEEYFITDYDDYTHIGLASICGEYANIEALNLLATQIDSMEDYEYDTFCAYCEAESPNDLETIYAVARTIVDGDADIFVYPDVENDEDLGRHFTGMVDCGVENLSEETKRNYFDYSAYGEHMKDTLDEEMLSAYGAADMSDYDFGWMMAEELGISDCDYDYYFDYEGYGRDIRFSSLGAFTKDGYVEYPNGAICDEGQLEEDLEAIKQANEEVMSSVEEVAKSYKKPQHDSVESNRNVGDGVVGRGVEKGR